MKERRITTRGALINYSFICATQAGTAPGDDVSRQGGEEGGRMTSNPEYE